MFGDYEPEDAWDASDTREEHIRNLLRRLALLERLIEDDPDILDRIEERVNEARTRSDLDDRDRLRIQQLLEDIATTRGQ